MPTSPVCVDASLVVRLLADVTDRGVRALWEGWHAAGVELHAPGLLFYEVTNALRQYERKGVLDSAEVDEALDVALALPIRVVDGGELHRHAALLARRLGLASCYDAHYLALAERLGGELWTCDGKLSRALHGKVTGVRLVH